MEPWASGKIKKFELSKPFMPRPFLLLRVKKKP